MRTLTQKADEKKSSEFSTWEFINGIKDRKTFSSKVSDVILKLLARFENTHFSCLFECPRIKLLQNDFLVVDTFSKLPK